MMKQGTRVKICCGDHDCAYADRTGKVHSIYQSGTLVIVFSDGDEAEFEPYQVEAIGS